MLFLAVLEVFTSSPKRLVFNILLFFLFCFFGFFFFPFVFPFKIPSCFFGFYPWAPFWKTLSFLFFCVCFLPFLTSCLVVSLKQTFLTSPFSKPTCFNFWQSLLCFMFLPFCFYVGFVLACFDFVVVLFCFVSCLLLDYDKTLFSLQF